MINIKNFITAPKITWIRKLIKSNDSPVQKLFETTIAPINKLTNFGCQYLETQIHKIQNKFWHDTLSSWIYMTKKIKPNNYLELCQLNIWYNPLIS